MRRIIALPSMLPFIEKTITLFGFVENSMYMKAMSIKYLVTHKWFPEKRCMFRHSCTVRINTPEKRREWSQLIEPLTHNEAESAEQHSIIFNPHRKETFYLKKLRNSLLFNWSENNWKFLQKMNSLISLRNQWCYDFCTSYLYSMAWNPKCMRTSHWEGYFMLFLMIFPFILQHSYSS